MVERIVIIIPNTIAGYYLRARIQARWSWATVVLVSRLATREVA